MLRPLDFRRKPIDAQLIDGRAIADEILAEAAEEVALLKESHQVTPGLAVVLVGEDPASEVYVRNKTVACQRVGIAGQTFALPRTTREAEVVELVQRLNADDSFDGILVQLPLPVDLRQDVIIGAVSPEKDVDGLHPMSMGRLMQGLNGLAPATPLAIQEMLLRSGHPPGGKHVVICGRSDLVGKPLAILLAQKAPGANATVTICHTGTRALDSMTRQADILVVAIGSPEFIVGDMVREGAVVIDVGINRVQDSRTKRGYRLVGDVHFESARRCASAITPVPGGVGPVTVATLVSNTVKATKMRLESKARVGSRP